MKFSFFNLMRQTLGERCEQFILKTSLAALFRVHGAFFYKSKCINLPKGQFILAIWHAHQCGLNSIPPEIKAKTNIMISKSRDGNIIAFAAEQMGFKTVRGSSGKKGSVSSLMELVSLLKQGENAAITIDGPRGPKHVVKMGVIELAKLSGIPIVPMMWYSGKNGDIQFKTWDGFAYPVPLKVSLNLFGEPVYVPEDADEQKMELCRKQVEDSLESLHETLVRDYEILK